MDTNQSQPILDAPGAGLPAPELFIARRLFALKRRFGSREGFSRAFAVNRASIRTLVESAPPEQRDRRVLIPRLRGLEDSSRHWSVWMTLDHLVITNRAFAGAIRALASGRVPPTVASTAAVKPSPEAGEECEEAFENSCKTLDEIIASIPDLRTPLRYEHPWFGPLDAAGWHALAATHLGIHRAQIAAISERLSRGKLVG